MMERILSMYGQRISCVIICLMLLGSPMQGRKKKTSAVFAPQLEQLYARVDALHPSKAQKRAPLIGLTTSGGRDDNSASAITMAGGIPILIVPTSDPIQLETIVRHLDGLFMTGGEDVAPAYYGHENHPNLGGVNDERDLFELTVFRKAFQRGIPIFGVCRGMQMINVAMGGTLWQDIPSQLPSDIKHRGTHTIDLEPQSESAQVLEVTHAMVNSTHHQCVRDVAPGLKVTAHSPDGVPEMLEGYPDHRIMATQFHPEALVVHNNDSIMLRFFRFFVEECRK